MESTANRIYKARLETDFTQLPNDMLQRADLSWKAKGLLAYLISLPDDWVVYRAELQNHAKDGREATDNAFNELIKHGYIQVVPMREVGTGRFLGNRYNVSFHPIYLDNQPETGFPYTDKPDPGNPPLQKKHSTKKQDTKKHQQPDSEEKGADAVVVEEPIRSDIDFEFAKTKINQSKSEVLAASIFREQVCMSLRIKPDYYETLVDAFYAEQIALAEAKEEIIYNGLKHHLKNWIRKQVNLGAQSRFHPDFKPVATASPYRNGQTVAAITPKFVSAIPD